MNLRLRDVLAFAAGMALAQIVEALDQRRNAREQCAQLMRRLTTRTTPSDARSPRSRTFR